MHPRLHLLVRKIAFLEILLGKRVVRRSDLVDQLHARFLDGVLHVRGDLVARLGLGAVGRVDVGLATEQINDTLEIRAFAHEDFHGGESELEALLDRFDRRLDLDVLEVALGEDQVTRKAELHGPMVEPVGHRLHAVLRRHDEDDRIRRRHRGARVTEERPLPGGVDEVDLRVPPDDVRHARHQRPFARLLLGLVIQNARLGDDTPQRLGRAPDVQHALHEGGLAGTFVADDDNVSDLLGFEPVGHFSALLR